MNVHAVPAGNPGPMTGTGNWTYVLQGRRPVLIDAGVGEAAHVEALAAICPEGPAALIATHAHGDHVAGAPVLAARWPEMQLARWPLRVEGAIGQLRWRPLSDGALIQAGDDTLEAVHTPGHAPDHIALWHSPSRLVFVGDLLVHGSSVVVLASRGGHLRSYLQSLRRIRALQPARALPAHGPAIEDPVALIDAYLAHRDERETQVIDALNAGLTSPEAIVARIYTGLDPRLQPMARESVVAHLLKLEEDNVAVREGAEWRHRR